MMENPSNTTIEKVKIRMEEQLKHLRNLKIEEDKLKNVNQSYLTLYEENMKELKSQKEVMQATTSNIIARRDNFCQNIYDKESHIDDANPDKDTFPDEEKIEQELQECDKHVAYLRKLNANVSIELIAMKARAARAREERGIVDEDSEEQENVKNQISQLYVEVQKLEIDATSREKRKFPEDDFSFVPPNKRQFISDPVPPLNSPNTTDDEDFQPVCTKIQPGKLNFTKRNDDHDTNKDDDPQIKSIFVFKEAVEQTFKVNDGASTSKN